MANHINQADSSHVRYRSCLSVVALHAIVNIGATGAPTVAKSPDAKFNCTRTSTGLYALTFPPGKNAWVHVSLLSAANTVVSWNLSALDANAGTASFRTLAGTNAAAVTDPANGDKLLIQIEVEG